MKTKYHIYNFTIHHLFGAYIALTIGFLLVVALGAYIAPRCLKKASVVGTAEAANVLAVPPSNVQIEADERTQP